MFSCISRGSCANKKIIKWQGAFTGNLITISHKDQILLYSCRYKLPVIYAVNPVVQIRRYKMALNAIKMFACGVCMAYIEEKYMTFHVCAKDWHSISIDTNSRTFYPTNQNGERLAKIEWEGKEQVMLLKPIADSTIIRVINNEHSTQSECHFENAQSENLTTSDNSTIRSQKCDISVEEMLIEEVKKRPPIYDYTLPLSVRGRQKMADLWKDISEALDGVLSPEEAKKRWKSLKDTFSKIIAEEKKPSGSSRTVKKTWKHLELMSFLRSISTSKSSISNVTVIESVVSDNSLENQSDQSFAEIQPKDTDSEEYKDQRTKNRSKDTDNALTHLTRLADQLCNKETPVINLPKLPEIAALDGMFLYIKEKLQKLNQQKQDKLLLKFLQDINKEEEC